MKSFLFANVPLSIVHFILFMIFGGWLVAIIVAGAYFLLRKFCTVQIYQLACIVIFAVFDWLLGRWLMRRGAERFAAL